MNELDIRDERPAGTLVSNDREPELVDEEALDVAKGSYRNTQRPEIQERQGIRTGVQESAAIDSETVALFSQSDLKDFQSQWSELQIGFVDDPRRAVAEADKLVETVTQRIAAGFAAERARLEKQWDRGEDVTTEEMRVTMQRYRSFFGRLLKL
jgi:hypothetical protein